MTPPTRQERLDRLQWMADIDMGVRSTPVPTPFTVEHLPDGYRNAYQYLNVPRRSTRAVIGNAYRKMSRALSAYGFCVTGGFRSWTDAAKVLWVFSRDLHDRAAMYFDNMVTREFLHGFEKRQVLGDWEPVRDPTRQRGYCHPDVKP